MCMCSVPTKHGTEVHCSQRQSQLRAQTQSLRSLPLRLARALLLLDDDLDLDEGIGRHGRGHALRLDEGAGRHRRDRAFLLEAGAGRHGRERVLAPPRRRPSPRRAGAQKGARPRGRWTGRSNSRIRMRGWRIPQRAIHKIYIFASRSRVSVSFPPVRREPYP